MGGTFSCDASGCSALFHNMRSELFHQFTSIRDNTRLACYRVIRRLTLHFMYKNNRESRYSRYAMVKVCRYYAIYEGVVSCSQDGKPCNSPYEQCKKVSKETK